MTETLWSGRVRGAVSVLLLLSLFLSSCGYRVVGSTFLPFSSITLMPVQNRTYEPRLEEALDAALSSEFLNQGVEVRRSGGTVVLEAVITAFQLGAIGAVDEIIKEQEILMQADITVTDEDGVMKFKSMQSPIRITFQTTGTVTDSVAEKDRAIERASQEIAREVVGRILVRYAK